MAEFSILIPHDPDGGQRDRIVAWTAERWRHFMPEAEVLVGGVGKLNRSANRNLLAAQAQTDLLAFIDADAATNIEAMRSAVELARTATPWVKFSGVHWVTKEWANHLIRRGPHCKLSVPAHGLYTTSHTLCGLVFLMRRAVLESVSGWDERFVGWGEEDLAMTKALECLFGPTVRVPHYVYHLWHPRGAEHDKQSKTFQANKALCRKYIIAHEAADKEQMMAVIRGEA